MKIKNFLQNNDFAIGQKNYNKYNFENMLNIYKDKKNNNIFNLNSTLYLYINKKSFLTYLCKTDNMFWTTISYLIYGTTKLAWLLMKINDIKSEDIFKPINSGDIVYYINKNEVNDIIQFINR